MLAGRTDQLRIARLSHTPVPTSGAESVPISGSCAVLQRFCPREKQTVRIKSPQFGLRGLILSRTECGEFYIQ